MNDEERTRKRTETLEFRYALVAELANPYLNSAQVSDLIRQKAAQEHEILYAGSRRLSEACIRKWMYAYRKHGKAGLEPKLRSDSGRCRSLTETETAVLLSALEAKPNLAATTVLAGLRKQGKITGTISSSSLSRLVCAAGLKREQRRQAAEDEKHLKFEFHSPLECVQADCMHSFPVPDGKGNRRKAILLAFIDDATRRILYTNFAFSERSVDFEAGIKHILSAHGRIGRVYVDNGANFVSSQTKRITDSLGLLLIHSRPYTPRGRGKIERFFRTARGQFFRTLDPETIGGLGDLSVRFRSWVEAEYHRSPHRGLNRATPLDRWLLKASGIIALDPTIDLDHAFQHEITRKVYRDSTLTLEGVLYEVPSTLIGERITLRYDPSVPAERRRLAVLLDGTECGTARIVDSYANTRVRRTTLHKDLVAEERTDTEDARRECSPSVTGSSLAASALPFFGAESKEGPDE
jgi:transposase InsO family protein